MWIHSIKLRNFKSYDNAAFSFPTPEDGKNIVLIGAQNGHGKTTLLEAVYLCLYGKDAISHLQRAGLNTQKSSYPEFLKSALYHEAETKYGQYTMSLEIEIRQNYREAQHGLRIRRKWHFGSDRNVFSGEYGSSVTAEIMKNGVYNLIDEKDLDKYINAFALPFDYAPFFFFDGEKIVQTAQQSGTGLWLNTALKGLLGVTLLEKLRVSLKDYRSKCISEGATAKMQDDLRKAETNLQSAEAVLQVTQEEFAEADKKWQQAAAKREQLMQQLGGGSDIRTSEDLLRQRERLEKEMAEFEEKVKAAIKAMPLAFLPRENLKVLQQQLQKEKNRLNHEAGKNQIAEKVDDFWNAFVSSDKVNQALGAMANMILSQPLMKEAVKDCWEDLFYPLPSECADKIEHNYLSVNAHAEIQNEISRLRGMPQEQIGTFLAENEKREEERKKILAEIELLRGTNKDELVEQLKKTNEETEKFKEQVGYLNSNVIRQKKDYQRFQKEVGDLQDKISDSNPRLLKSRRAGEVDKVIIRLTEELLKRKVKEVGEAATRINRAIAHDERIDRIRVESDGRMGIFGRDGYESRVDLSAGQMQILIMSLVSALAEVTRYHAPFIIDTPLARLDEGHREGLFRHWCNLDQQVILLSQDTEITPEVCRRLEPHVSRTYLVEAESLDSAGARSRVVADVYFE
ncbi:DNA sulfur modification protein DndD [Neisseria animalis]|uniref:DNA sulfur modification protein DndD n=1 Tax=Neisseria animalis TaxID=492 RepID=A0A5P3MPI5_NEIAN|nr:DNA sulfur modification protein DndD [Neisseria animalis]QEY23388.1 DNA sulfur modification protein DndD [Neisseria animalis]ROW33234.1 DNA sulfur modification protein DndD [Neisseria animalis]VEE08828.1 recombination protein F [Neisseria animalis]